MASVPNIKAFPGPKAQELQKMKEAYVTKGAGTLGPLFAAKAQGAVVEDVDGNVFLDFAGGIGVLNVGHCPDTVVAAIKDQADKVIHTCYHVMVHEPYLQLAKKLIEITPGSFPKKAFFVNAGVEAVENTVKFSRKFTGKRGVISLEAAFHGRTLMGMSLTSKVKPYRFGFGPFAPETYKIHTPYCYRCLFGATYGNCDLDCLKYVERFFAAEAPVENMAAIIVEVVQGEGGFIPLPVEFLKGVQDLCHKYGIVFVVDEIQTGFCRTGKMFACEHYGLEPDLIALAKSLGAGMPLSGVVGKAEIMDSPNPGEIGGTYGGNALSCVAALAAIEMMESEKLADRAAAIGARMRERFLEIQEKCALVGDVRNLGAMIGIELVKDRKTKEPAAAETGAAIQEMIKRGLIGLKAGIFDNVIRFLVPLVITDEQLDAGLDIIEAALLAVSK